MSSTAAPQEKYTVLASVSDKDGLVEFMTALATTQRAHGRVLEILSTGGTATALKNAGFDVIEIADYTGLEAMMGDRVKTLHPKVHGALLQRGKEDDEVREKLGIKKIDMAILNLYPFKKTVAKAGATLEEAIENIDIGGPAMVRSSAKNYERVTVVTNPGQYNSILTDMETNAGETTLKTRMRLSRIAFQHTAEYDTAISRYLAKREADMEYESNGGDQRQITPDKPLRFDKPVRLKYGENAHQKHAYFIPDEDDITNPLGLANFTVIEGTLPSFVGFTDIARLVAYLESIEEVTTKNDKIPAIALGVKHGNTCGASIHDDPVEAVKNMVNGDPRAIFGGAVLLSFPVTEEVMDALLHHDMPDGKKRLLDEIIAPSFTPEAIALAARKNGKCRFITNPNLISTGPRHPPTQSIRTVRDGVLLQDAPRFIPTIERFSPTPTPEVWHDIQLAWAIGSRSTSNTITLVKNGQLIGNGVGQQDRVGAAELAVKRALDSGHDAQGAVAYSDSFFPFPDGIEALAQAGIKTIFATSGSVQDDNVRGKCKELGVTLYTFPDKEARGFSQH